MRVSISLSSFTRNGSAFIIKPTISGNSMAQLPHLPSPSPWQELINHSEQSALEGSFQFRNRVRSNPAKHPQESHERRLHLSTTHLQVPKPLSHDSHPSNLSRHSRAPLPSGPHGQMPRRASPLGPKASKLSVLTAGISGTTPSTS